MANREHIEILKQGTIAWNKWREKHNDVQPDFESANMVNLDLPGGASGVNLRNANFKLADLTNSDLSLADLEGATFQGATLRSVNFRKAHLKNADFEGTDLSLASLHRADASNAIFRNATLAGTGLDVSTCDGADFSGAIMSDIYYEDDPFIEFYAHTNFLELAFAIGKNQLHPESNNFIDKFIPDAFRYIHNLQSPMNMELTKVDTFEEGRTPVALGVPETFLIGPMCNDSEILEGMLQKIRCLERLYCRQYDPTLVHAINVVNSELINYLKKHPNELNHLHWRTFEELVAELLSNFGWEVQLTKPSKDNGYDIMGIYRDISGISNTWIIECKHWGKQRKVGIEIARGLYTIKNELKVGGAILATTSNFTKGVHQFSASRYDFALKDYEGILEWINHYR